MTYAVICTMYETCWTRCTRKVSDIGSPKRAVEADEQTLIGSARQLCDVAEKEREGGRKAADKANQHMTAAAINHVPGRG